MQHCNGVETAFVNIITVANGTAWNEGDGLVNALIVWNETAWWNETAVVCIMQWQPTCTSINGSNWTV